MIVALIFGAIVAIAMITYLDLALNSRKIAHRSFYFNAASNMADLGTEHALWSLNNMTNLGVSTAWANGLFVSGGGGYQGSFGPFSLSGGAEGSAKVWVEDPSPWLLDPTLTGGPRAVVRGTVTFPNATPISKTTEMYLEPRSLWKGGMVSRNGMRFTGNATVDSWISRPTPTDDIPYSVGPARSNGRIASPQLIAIQNADIFGYISIGTDDYSGLTYNSGQATISGNLSASRGTIDLTRVTNDFTGDFPDISAPSGTASAAISLNSGAAVNIPSGTYVVPSITIGGSSNGLEIGTTGASPVIADVTYVVTGDLRMTGGGNITVNPGSKLTIYVAGDIQMTGTGGFLNGTTTAPNNPDCLTIYGTRTARQIADGAAWQDWNLKGKGYLSATIFAPNADLDVDGGGTTYGSLVGEFVTMVGNGAFHQDESLKNKRTSGLWQMSKWREITSESELAPSNSAIAGKLSF